MAGKRKIGRTTEELRGISDYYKLNTRAVDDLASADASNTPQYSEEELKKYRSKGGLHLPEWLKAVLIKAWFAGSVCFFIFWGLGMYLADMLDMLVVLAIALGVITDILVNNIFRFYEEVPGGNSRWMMFPKKSYFTFFLNILYSGWLLFCVYTAYQAINGVLVMMMTEPESIPLGVEPIGFGLFYMGFDILFISMKQLFLTILSDAKKKG